MDVPGEKLPSQVSGALSEYLTSHVANEVRGLCSECVIVGACLPALFCLQLQFCWITAP